MLWHNEVMKICRTCTLEKELLDFPRKKSGYVYPDCKSCSAVKRKVYDQRYNDTHRAEVNERARRYRERHKDDPIYQTRIKEHARNQREREREQRREYMRNYKKLNRERLTHHEATRRARKRAAEGSFTFDEWVELCITYENVCLACNQERPLTIDHIKPLAQGGSNWISNIQPLCKECNSVKGNKEIDYRLGRR